MTTATELIILHTTKFSESSLVVHTLSRAFGRRSFLVRKPRMSMFLPLSLVEADISENPKSKLWNASNFSSRHPLNGIRSNIYKNTMTLFLSEVLFKTIKEGSADEGLFDWCERSILLLDALNSDFSNFHLRFLLEEAVHLGFRPDLEGLMPFVGERLETAEKLLTLPFTEAMLVPLSGKARGEIAGDFLRYIEFHSESPVNINSLKVLAELFRNPE